MDYNNAFSSSSSYLFISVSSMSTRLGEATPRSMIANRTRRRSKLHQRSTRLLKNQTGRTNHRTISNAQADARDVELISTAPRKKPIIINSLLTILVGATLITSSHLLRHVGAYKSGGSERMVRLCIASVDPIKLTSQCVMCNRREFPLTVIDCTGITKVNDLIANPLSVQEATCLIYNCRRQVPDVKPEPYHGSVSHAVNYRGAASNYHSTGMGGPVSGSSIYEMMTPSGIFGGGYPSASAQSSAASSSPYMTRYGSNFLASNPYQTAYSPSGPRGMIGGPSLVPDRQQALPYALVPAPRTFPFD